MITKRIAGRKDRGSSARSALRYGEGLKKDRVTGNMVSKSHRTRLANFGLVDDGIYIVHSAGEVINSGQIDDGKYIANCAEEMAEIIELAAAEMQATCDRNMRVGAENKIAHFLFSFDQSQPSDAVLRDTEDSMIAALGLSDNHWASFLHSDNGHWHLHLFASRIDKVKHLGNDLWMDMTIRDRVAREIEKRHGLERDNGMHRIEANGQIVEVPREEREVRKGQKSIITDRARTSEIHSGEKTFQSWAEGIRIGDRLKHGKSWQDLHAAAAAYGCEIRQKGAGFIICPNGEKGGIQLSKLGLKNLPAKFGAFQPPSMGNRQINPVAAYKPEPTIERGASHYSKWQESKRAFQPIKTAQLNELREKHVTVRKELKEQHRNELGEIRARTTGDERFAAVSVAKMQQAIQLSSLSDRFKQVRQALYKELATQGPGNTYRDYLVREAQKGDIAALQLARKYGMDETTKVSREREVGYLRIKAAIAGKEYLPAPRLPFTHHIEPSGTVVYELGHDRQIVDSALARRIQLNDVAALDPEAIETALRFATLKFGSTLTLTGPAEFQKLAVETAVRERLGIKFADPALEAYRLKLIEQQHSFSTHRNKESHYASNHRIEHLRQIPPAHIRHRLYNVPIEHMVRDTSRDVLPLRTNVSNRLEQPAAAGLDRAMQRTTGRAQGAGDAVRRSAAGYAVDWGHKGSGGEEVPLTTPDQSPQEQTSSQSSAHAWAEEWANARGKGITGPQAGSGNVPFEVVYAGPDGVVLNLGRRVAVYPPTDLEIKDGDRVGIGRNKEILLLQKSLDQGKGR